MHTTAACTCTRVCVRVCTTRDSSTSTIRGARRSTPPRFNIQTICNNFAATITSFFPLRPFFSLSLSHSSRTSVLPPFRFTALSLSLFLAAFLLRPSCRPPALAFSFVVSIVYSPLPRLAPSAFPVSSTSLSLCSARNVLLPSHEDVARSNTPTPTLRDCSSVCTVPSSTLRPQSL